MLQRSNAGMFQLIVKRRGFVESLELHQIAVAQQPSGSGSGERGCVHRPFLAENVRQKVLRYFRPGLVEQLTSITVLEGVSTSQQLEMDMISLLCSASVKFEMCGQVSDRAPSLLWPAMPCHACTQG